VSTRAPVERIEIDLRARERNLYDRLRARVVDRDPGGDAGVRDLLLFLPDMVVLLVRLARDSRVPPGVKAVATLGIGYSLSPIDLLPEFLFGPLGFLDDLVIAAAAISYIVNHVHPDLVRSHWPGQGDVLEVVKRVLAYAEGLVGKALRRVFKLRDRD